MYKIRKIKFINHPILKNLELDFCDSTGEAVSTIILAGENGTCKSTILRCLYSIICGMVDFEAAVEMENDEERFNLIYFYKEVNHHVSIWVKLDDGLITLPRHEDFSAKHNFNGIFSDVDINFNSSNISNVTSMVLDSDKKSIYSTAGLPSSIKQLLIDVQALDDAEISKKYREAKYNGTDVNDIHIDERMNRFTNAFNNMFDQLKYSHVENKQNHKEIIFKKNGVSIPIDGLSSGEKQIVYRGAFLLKNINALKGAFVFIDEPEISLHPNWQMKIMDYYKNIFTDQNGRQTSQIFTVTHSPFIIHNDLRKDDKVIVIRRDENGELDVLDKCEYYKCECMEAITDAFSINKFIRHGFQEESTVYLEGRTDEKYFNKAVEVYGYEQLPFKFKWVGYTENDKEYNTGATALDNAFNFCVSKNMLVKNGCLYDCDTKKEKVVKNNVIRKSIPYYDNSKNMKKGIENSLILDDVDISSFYIKKETTGDYGEKKIIEQLDKMKLCNYICGLEADKLMPIFENLKKEIDELKEFMKQ